MRRKFKTILQNTNERIIEEAKFLVSSLNDKLKLVVKEKGMIYLYFESSVNTLDLDTSCD